MLTIHRLILTAKNIPIIAVHGSGYCAVCEGVDGMVIIITVYDGSLVIKFDYLVIKELLGPGHPAYRSVRPQRLNRIVPVNLVKLVVAIPESVQCLCR